MKPKTMILMVVAVACGLVASYMTSRLLADRNSAPPENLVQVVVAKKNVPQLTLVRKPDDLFEVQQVPESPLTAKAVKSLDELKDKRVKNTVKQGDFIRVDDIQKKDDLIIEVPAGQRAIAIQVNAKSLTGGFVLPGMRVDVISMMRRGDEPMTMLLLQNMLILAIDTQSSSTDKTTMIGQTATLAATPEECQRLIQAQGQGELCLVLRNPDDKHLVTIGVTKNDTLLKPVRDRDPKGEVTDNGTDNSPGYVGLGKEPPPAPTPTVEPTVIKVEEKKPEPKPEPPPPVTHILTITEGGYSQQVTFTKDPQSGEWLGGSGKNEEAPPARKPAVKPEPSGK
jgi:pilus assembly protein CpaB